MECGAVYLVYESEPPNIHTEVPLSATSLISKEKAMRQSVIGSFLKEQNPKCCMGKKDVWYDPNPALPQPCPHPQIPWSFRLWDIL